MKKEGNIASTILLFIFLFSSCNSHKYTVSELEDKKHKITKEFLKKYNIVFTLSYEISMYYCILGIDTQQLDYKKYVFNTKIKDTSIHNTEINISALIKEIDSIQVLRNKVYIKIDTTHQPDSLRFKTKKFQKKSKVFLDISINNISTYLFSEEEVQKYPNIFKIYNIMLWRIEEN